jgi:hypothetical protein
MPLNGFTRHRPSIEAYPRRKAYPGAIDSVGVQTCYRRA